MEISPINERIHRTLMQKGYTWKQRGYVDMYKKEDTLIFIYMNSYCFMLINGKVGSAKEFALETGDLPC
jgi:hypothetical protein